MIHFWSIGLSHKKSLVDATNGNVYIAESNTEGSFTCDSISSSFYSFDPITRTFATLGDMPRPRYRHTSSAVGNQVWLVGGRDPAGDLVSEIDVSGE